MAGKRIPFGKRGLKDEAGNVTRTDHPTMTDAVKDMLFGGAPKSLKNRKRNIDKAVDDMSKLKKKQDSAAKITRRKA